MRCVRLDKRTKQNHTESTAIVQKVQPVRDLRVKRKIVEVVQDLRYVLCICGIGGKRCGLIKVAVT